MNLEVAIDILHQLVFVSLMTVAPILLTAIGVGLAVSILQTVTSIQEQTLTFIPKLVAIGIVLIIAASWMMRTVMEFAIGMIGRIPLMAP